MRYFGTVVLLRLVVVVVRATLQKNKLVHEDVDAGFTLKKDVRGRKQFARKHGIMTVHVK